MPNVHVETRLLEAEYELLKDFKEKNGLKTDYQGLKELVKALDIPEFHEEIKPEEKKEVKKEVRHIDRTNLENWVKDLGFEQEFHETKSERKFYEDKKQKALEYLNHTIKEFDGLRSTKITLDYSKVLDRFDYKLNQLRNLVNDI